jgi:NAD(P)-dependent dehydrogenase (short-subunit alcohol dehydrogenase family)
MAASSSVIITGAAGSLGSAIANQLIKLYSNQFHLILAARNINGDNATRVSENIRASGAAFSWEKLDLSILQSVDDFAIRIRTGIENKTIPPLYALINSAAISQIPVSKTVDGFDLIYQTNALSPLLLTRRLTPIFEKSVHGLPVVLNVSSAAISMGNYKYFQDSHATLDDSLGRSIGVVESLKIYGSSKLLLLMAGYSLQREPRFVSYFSD